MHEFVYANMSTRVHLHERGYAASFQARQLHRFFLVAL